MKKHIYCHSSSEYEIPFFDVDSMDIMWHGYYVKYLEMARCAFLEEIHYTYDVMRTQGYAWPIVQLNVKYVKPARFRQKIRVDVALVEYESSIRVDYVIRAIDSGEKLTIASTTQVAVSINNQEMQFTTPQCWRNAVESHPTFQRESV